MPCPGIYFLPTFPHFRILDSSLSLAGSSHQLPQTPLPASLEGLGQRSWEWLLNLFRNSPALFWKYLCLLACTGNPSKLYILLTHKREDKTLLIIIPLFRLGAIRLNILGWNKFPSAVLP